MPTEQCRQAVLRVRQRRGQYLRRGFRTQDRSGSRPQRDLEKPEVERRMVEDLGDAAVFEQVPDAGAG